jgi:hypothetical protein
MITMRVMGPSPVLSGRSGTIVAGAVTLGPMGLYAAYGSNMDPAQMLRRCPSSPHIGTGWVPGWRLTFGAEEYGWDGALATLVPEDAAAPGVFVALYDLTAADERALDAWEGADQGLYQRVHLGVRTLEGDEVAYAYVLDAFEGGLPSARHLGGIADVAEAAGAPTDYVTALRSRECRSTGI